MGEAMTTDFKMIASVGWTDPDGDDITFQFAYAEQKDDGTLGTFTAAAPTPSSVFIRQFPTGEISIQDEDHSEKHHLQI